MLGGGFLRQMAETVKYNRDLLKKPKHKPFEKKESSKKIHNEQLPDIKMSDVERMNLLSVLKEQRRKENMKCIIVLIISIALTVLILIIFSWAWVEKTKDFIR